MLSGPRLLATTWSRASVLVARVGFLHEIVGDHFVVDPRSEPGTLAYRQAISTSCVADALNVGVGLATRIGEAGIASDVPGGYLLAA